MVICPLMLCELKSFFLSRTMVFLGKAHHSYASASAPRELNPQGQALRTLILCAKPRLEGSLANTSTAEAQAIPTHTHYILNFLSELGQTELIRCPTPDT